MPFPALNPTYLTLQLILHLALHKIKPGMLPQPR